MMVPCRIFDNTDTDMDNTVELTDSSTGLTLGKTIISIFMVALMIISEAYGSERPYVPLHVIPFRGSQFHIIHLVLVSITEI